MSPGQTRMPGSWLRRLATLIFDADTMARVVDPTLSDLQHECDHAGDDAGAKRKARLRGYLAFWKIVALSPFVFSDWPGRRQFAQSLVHVGAIVILIVVTFGAKSAWMMSWLAEFYPRLEGRFISIADLGPYVWMLTPIAVALLALFGRRSPFRAAPVAILMICSATIAAAASYGAAGFVAAFASVGRSGSTGVGPIISAFEALVLPSLLALVITVVSLMLIGVSQWRARHVPALDSGIGPNVPGAAGFVLVGSMALAIIAANRWMLINEELIEAALALLNPARADALGGGRVVLGMTEIAFPLMMLGLVIAATMLAAAFMAWRASRARRPSQFVIWSTRLAVIALLAGCAWHASVLTAQWRTFRSDLSALQSR